MEPTTQFYGDHTYRTYRAVDPEGLPVVARAVNDFPKLNIRPQRIKFAVTW